MKRVRAALVFAGTLCLASCATRAPRTPERLYAAYMDALRRDDPSAAYALLSPELQATLPRAEFDARWKAQAAEHRAILAAREPNPPPIAYRGTTVHEGGRILVWAAAPGNKAFYVESGLPSQARLDTPAAAIRTFLAAIRQADRTLLLAVLHDDLRTALREDWESRVAAMEAALQRPGALEVSADRRRAELRYAQGRALRLEHGTAGWQVTGLE